MTKLISFLLALVLTQMVIGQAPMADLEVLNATTHTMDAKRPQAMAVLNGKREDVVRNFEFSYS